MQNRATLIGLVLFGCNMARAATHYVVPTGTPGAPAANYLTWETAATSIQDALSVATNGSLVLVSNGTYLLTGTIVVSNAITLRSFNGGVVDREGTTIDGNFPNVTNRCLYVTNVAAWIEGFTFTNGFADASQGNNGGGVYLFRKGTVTNCVITGNSAARAGGGCYMDGGGLLTASTVTRNAATNGVATDGGYGGGLYVNGGTVSNSFITDNRSGFQGGGLWMFTSGGTVQNCTIAGNRAQPLPGVGGSSGYGGALWSGWGGIIAYCTIISNTAGPSTNGSNLGAAGVSPGNGMVVRDCLIADNYITGGGGYGGGIVVGTGRIVSNCVIRNNSAALGGGVYPGGSGLLLNCTIISNSSAAYAQGGTIRNCLFAKNGSGIWGHNAAGATYQNCTIADNAGVGIRLSIASRVENCIVYSNNSGGSNWSIDGTGADSTWTNSCTMPLPPGPYDTGNITNNPLFVSVASGDFRLKRTSPCINQGVNRSWMTNAVDLDGLARIQEDAVDIGAYEIAPRPGTLIYLK